MVISGSASAATINVNNSTSDSIKNAVGNASSGDTLNLSAGTYHECNIIIDKNLTITGPVTSGTPTAIIDAQQLGRVFYVNLNSGANVDLKYLTIQNGAKDNGGGIYNNGGTVTVTNCIINKNTATGSGGGIYNDVGTCTVTNCTISNNTATSGNGGGIFNSGGGTCTVTNCTISNNTATGNGGGIYNFGISTFTVTNSNINNNNATTGGGIYNGSKATVTVTNSNINNNTANNGGGISNVSTGTFTVFGCDFTSNQAKYSGNAIDNESLNVTNRIIHFNRFYDVASGYEIYNYNDSVDARYNWWGSNSNPATKIGGTGVDASSWLVLSSVSTDKLIIGRNGTANISVNLCTDSNGAYHDPALGHVPDGVPITFYSTLGILNIPVLTDGAAKSTLTDTGISGLANIYIILDNQLETTSVIIDATVPTVTSIDPANNAVINNTSKAVKITLNVAVQKGTTFNNITLTQNGTAIPITSTLNGNVLTLTNTGTYTDGTYTINIPTNALMEAAGNNINTYTSKFTIDTKPPVVSTSNPTNGKTGVKRSQTITVTFNENILAGSNYSKITLKSSTGKTITITKSISGKVLTIKHSALAAKTKYTLTLYSGSIKDQAGNPIATKTITFTTGST